MRVQESFLTECSLLAQLRHPHIITMLGMAVTKGQGMLLMELAEGKCHSVSMGWSTQGVVRAAGYGCAGLQPGATAGPKGLKGRRCNRLPRTCLHNVHACHAASHAAILRPPLTAIANNPACLGSLGCAQLFPTGAASNLCCFGTMQPQGETCFQPCSWRGAAEPKAALGCLAGGAAAPVCQLR